MPTKRAFYSAYNSDFSLYLCGTAADELVLLTLQLGLQSTSINVCYSCYCISRQVDELNVCWNNVFRRIFNYNKWESTKAVILGLGRLSLKHLIMFRKINFTDICTYLITACCEMFLDIFAT